MIVRSDLLSVAPQQKLPALCEKPAEGRRSCQSRGRVGGYVQRRGCATPAADQPKQPTKHAMSVALPPRKRRISRGPHPFLRSDPDWPTVQICSARADAQPILRLRQLRRTELARALGISRISGSVSLRNRETQHCSGLKTNEPEKMAPDLLRGL